MDKQSTSHFLFVINYFSWGWGGFYSIMKNFLVVILGALLLSSCAGFTHITAPNSVALNQGNFKFVRTVSANTVATYVFSFGGMTKSATDDVIEKLKENAKLRANQALADIRIKETKKYYALGIVIKKRITATASVVEFGEINSCSRSETIDAFEKQRSNDIGNSSLNIDEYQSQIKSVINSLPPDEAKVVVMERLKVINEELPAYWGDKLQILEAEIKDIKQWIVSFKISDPLIDRELKKIREVLKTK